MARRNNYDYAQPVIGDCGHISTIWPQVTGWSGKNPMIVCDTCTVAEYGSLIGVPAVWVRMAKVVGKPPPEEVQAAKKAAKKAAKPKPKSKWEQFLADQKEMF